LQLKKITFLNLFNLSIVSQEKNNSDIKTG
jgi:hypothetical protein